MESPHPSRQHQEAAIRRRIAPWRVLPPLLAVLLGLWGLERGGSMWRDESVTWQVAHRPLGGLWELLGQVDAVHGLYYLLMHGVFLIWDGGLWALRLPSVAATALAAAGVAAIAHRLAGERAALLAGLAYAVLSPVQMYAQEGRSYAMVAAAVIWSTYLMLRERWTAYTLVLLLGCWLHEFAALALLAHGATAWRSRGWRIAAAAIAALLLPLAATSAHQAAQQLGWLSRPGWEAWTAYGALALAVLLLARGAGGDTGGREPAALAPAPDLAPASALDGDPAPDSDLASDLASAPGSDPASDLAPGSGSDLASDLASAPGSDLAPVSAPAPAPVSAPAPAPDRDPAPAPDRDPAPAPDLASDLASVPGPDVASAPGAAPDTASDRAPAPAPGSDPAPAPDWASELASAPGSDLAPGLDLAPASAQASALDRDPAPDSDLASDMASTPGAAPAPGSVPASDLASELASAPGAAPAPDTASDLAAAPAADLAPDLALTPAPDLAPDLASATAPDVDLAPCAAPGPDSAVASGREAGPALGSGLVRVAVPLALLPPGVLLAVSLLHPWYVDRYVLYALAGLALLAGARLAAARGWWPWLLVGALLVPFALWSAWLRTPESRKDDVLAVAAAVRERARPGDAVVFLPSRRREWLLSSPQVYEGLRDVALDRSPAASRSLQGTELPSVEIREALIGSPRVIALLDPVGQPVDPYPREAVKRQTLAAWFDLCSITEARGARIAVYAAPNTCP